LRVNAGKITFNITKLSAVWTKYTAQSAHFKGFPVVYNFRECIVKISFYPTAVALLRFELMLKIPKP